MDRALQLELDRRAFYNTAAVLPELMKSEISLDIGFIDSPTLKSWKEWVCKACSNGFNWERLLFLSSRRQEPHDQVIAREIAKDFLRSVKNGLAKIFTRITEELIETYNARVIQESEKIAKEYLQCR